MRKNVHGILSVCATLLIMNPMNAFCVENLDDQRSQWSTPSTPNHPPCGPKCACGCLESNTCTCTPEQRAQTFNPTQPQEPQPQQACCSGCAQGGPCNCVENEPQQQECCESSNNCEDDWGDFCSYLSIDSGLFVYEPGCRGYIILPDDPPLYRPMMADPREVDYSVGWRFNDQALTKNVIDISFADSCALIRWLNVWPWCGQLQLDLEGGVWGVFDPCYESAPLMNADYYVGVPLTYAIDRWQFRLRGYHISSHIGDEFLLNHPGFDRRNPSAEYLDFFVSHDLTDEIRVYGGIGYTFFQDDSFHIKPAYAALGAELRLLRVGFYDADSMLYGCPIYGMYFRFSGEFKNHLDSTYVLGYEFGKLCGTYRRLRFFMEYHDGYSLEGQFCKFPTNYFSIRASYGY